MNTLKTASYTQILPYIVPSKTLSYQMACERTPFNHVCRYRIVEEPESVGTYAAVCDEGRCPTKVFARQELVRYTINPQAMGHVLARCLGLHPQVTQIHKHVWQVGNIAGSTELIPVFFNRPKSESLMRQALEHLLLEGWKGFVWVTPSARYIDAQVQQLLSRNESASFTLDEVTELEGQEIVLNEQGVVRWKKVRESLGGGAVLGAIFPTPQDAGWHDLTLIFRDGHTLVATIGRAKATYTYQVGVILKVSKFMQL